MRALSDPARGDRHGQDVHDGQRHRPDYPAGLALEALPELIDQLEGKIKEAAKKLDFEEAANLRDRVKQLRQKMAGTI